MLQKPLRWQFHVPIWASRHAACIRSSVGVRDMSQLDALETETSPLGPTWMLHWLEALLLQRRLFFFPAQAVFFSRLELC